MSQYNGWSLQEVFTLLIVTNNPNTSYASALKGDNIFGYFQEWFKSSKKKYMLLNWIKWSARRTEMFDKACICNVETHLQNKGWNGNKIFPSFKKGYFFINIILLPSMSGTSHTFFVCLISWSLTWLLLHRDSHALRGLVLPMTSSYCRFGFFSIA